METAKLMNYLYCACCGGICEPQPQWHNQDLGHGICIACWERIAAKEGVTETHRCYGPKPAQPVPAQADTLAETRDDVAVLRHDLNDERRRVSMWVGKEATAVARAEVAECERDALRAACQSALDGCHELYLPDLAPTERALSNALAGGR